MLLLPQQFMDVFQWLIRSSFQATILLVIILLIRAAVKKKLRFRMVYWLWMLLLLRLIWPLNLQTTFSVFNLIPPQAAPEHYFSTPAAEEPTVSVPLSGDKLVSPSNISAQSAEMAPSDVSASNEAQSAPIQTLPLAVAAKPAPFNWRQALCTAWLAGVVLMGGYVLFCNFRLWRIVTSQRLVTRQDILDLLEDCKAQLDLQTVIGVVETDKVKTPCLFGYLRPRLLLPTGTLDELTIEQLRYVFIHELAHLKRHDIFIGWLMATVQVLHWFNPAVWFAMTQINADRELACDELALSTLKENEPQAYGSTILTFLERFSRQQKLPAMAGIAENQSLLRRRLTMIASFKNKKVSFIPALAILLLLAATTFTSARTVREIDEHIFLKTDRGKVAVIQMPLSENDYTTILRFDDYNYGAAGWYDVTLKVATEQEMDSIRIKAYIDGISDLVFKGNTVYWHHRNWAVPGRHDENDYPTTINDIQWHPKWPEEKKNLIEPRGEQKSDLYNLPFKLPQSEISVTLEMTVEGGQRSLTVGPEWISVEDAQGPSGYALRFDGASNFVRVPNNPTLEPKEEMTIEMWACIDGPQSMNTRLLRKAGNMQPGYLLAADQVGDGRMQIRFDVGSGVIRAGSSKHTEYAGAWHHFAGVYAKDTIVFYVDGCPVDKQSHEPKEIMHSPVDLYIGHGAPGGPTEYFKGMIDEVRVWNVARTPQQIEANMYRTIPVDTSGLAAYWKFDEGQGSIAHDSTSNQNHAYLEYDSGKPLKSKTTVPSKAPSEMEMMDPMMMDEMMMEQEPPKIDISNLQAMIDEARPGQKVYVPAGTYDKPIRISKSIQLIGNKTSESIFKVTANEPAIIVDTKGKGQVLIENITIQWQLATSDQHEFPFAVAVKDTEATIWNCTFQPLGNPQRSPVAIRAMGFSNMDVAACDFEGFDYVICYGEGTKGKTFDCYIRNCGHQGVILYSGAEADVYRNIITGSRYHAVRTTGGRLNMRDNLIINNKNRGVYLGNKSGSGEIVNNLLIGNATGIDGISACRFTVRNNVILNSEYAAISAIPQAQLDIDGNVLSDNPRGIIIHQEESKSDPIRPKFGKNVFWKNQTNIEIQTTDLSDESIEMIEAEPDFIEPDNGNFTLADPAFEGMGLSDPKVIFDLWQKYKESLTKPNKIRRFQY